MSRPCFLVVDREYAGSISTRKLVIETAKINVITSYSGAEAIETLKRFPALDGVVMDSDIGDMPAQALIDALKAQQPHIPVVVICVPGTARCPEGDFQMESFDPARLLDLLKKITGAQSEAIRLNDEALRRKQ